MMPRTEKEIIKQILDRIEQIEERLRQMLDETDEIVQIIDKESIREQIEIDRRNRERRERW